MSNQIFMLSTALPWIVLTYLICSISFAVIVSRAFGLPDPRTFGSKNPGATNVMRTGKKVAALLTLLGDTGKAILALWIVKLQLGTPPAISNGFSPYEITYALCAFAAILGHIYPIFFRFEGGKGVATGLGILLMLSPWLGLAVLASWVLVFFMWRVSSLSAIMACLLAPLYASVFFGTLSSYTLTVVALSGLLLFRHQSNIRNLLTGQEKAFKNND